MTSFIPDLKHTPASSVPYFEDSQQQKIPGRGTEKSLEQLQREISGVLAKLGAFGIEFIPGVYPGSAKRYGFQIRFQYANARGRMDCAALPMRHETPVKKRAAIAQALYLLRNKLEAMLYASIYEPGGLPLVPYLIGAGDKTVTEAMIEAGNLPLIAGK